MAKKRVSLKTRKPGQKPSEAEIERFESLAESRGSQVPGDPDPEPESAPPTKKGRVERKGRLLSDGSRRGAKELRRMTVYLPPALAKELAVFCAEVDAQYSEVIAQAVEAWLRRHK